MHVDNKHFWENNTDAPLPRREYSKRNDYNVMLRGNRHEITENGWIHGQDNEKIIRQKGKEDILLAREKGMNSYRRVNSTKCEVAKAWWADHSEFWSKVRDSWDEVYSHEGDLTLAKKVEEKPLYRFLFSLEKDGASQAEISEVIRRFIVSDKQKVAAGSK